MVQLSLDVKVLVLHHTAEDVSKVDIDTATNTLPVNLLLECFLHLLGHLHLLRVDTLG